MRYILLKKYYYIPSDNKRAAFTVQFKHTSVTGETYYLAHSCDNGEEVWLYKDAIEYTERGKKHKIVSAYEVPYNYNQPHISLNPYEYVWGGEVRDKRARSMCARPYFNR